MYRTSPTLKRSDKSFIDQTITIPMFLVVMGLWQRYCLTHETSKGIRLWQRLTIKLINPLWGTICRNGHKRDMLIVSLSHSRCEIQECSTTGNTHYDRLSECLCHSQGIEACRAFISHGVTLDSRALVEVVNDGRVTAARTHHGMLHPMCHEQTCQYVYILLITIHLY
jgi:hypothetical protein